MKSAALAASLQVFCLVMTTVAQERLTPETLKRVKAATVFIRIGQTGGSGFLLSKKGEVGQIITNAHVVAGIADKPGKTAECVFHSGTEREFLVQGKVAYFSKAQDLAMLMMTHADLPEPLAATVPEDELSETMTVFTIGFPFGDALRLETEMPNVTVSRGSITSLRLKKDRKLSVIQIDAGVNPGNSGGPVIASDGRLIGVAVAKVLGTDVGFAIPAREIDRLMRAETSTTFTAKCRGGDLTWRSDEVIVDAQIESVRRVKELEAGWVRDEGLKPEQAEETTAWKPIGAASWRRLERVSSIHHAGKFSLPFDDGRPVPVWVQIRATFEDGTQIWSEPKRYERSLQDGVSLNGLSLNQPELGQRHKRYWGDAEKKIELPGEVHDVVRLRNGAALAIQIRKPSFVVIVDLSAGEIVAKLAVPEDAKIAGTSDELWAISSDGVRIWDREKWAPSPIVFPWPTAEPPIAVAAGWAQKSRLACVCRTAKGSAETAFYLLRRTNHGLEVESYRGLAVRPKKEASGRPELIALRSADPCVLPKGDAEWELRCDARGLNYVVWRPGKEDGVLRFQLFTDWISAQLDSQFKSGPVWFNATNGGLSQDPRCVSAVDSSEQKILALASDPAEPANVAANRLEKLPKIAEQLRAITASRGLTADKCAHLLGAVSLVAFVSSQDRAVYLANYAHGLEKLPDNVFGPFGSPKSPRPALNDELRSRYEAVKFAAPELADGVEKEVALDGKCLSVTRAGGGRYLGFLFPPKDVLCRFRVLDLSTAQWVYEKSISSEKIAGLKDRFVYHNSAAKTWSSFRASDGELLRDHDVETNERIVSCAAGCGSDGPLVFVTLGSGKGVRPFLRILDPQTFQIWRPTSAVRSQGDDKLTGARLDQGGRFLLKPPSGLPFSEDFVPHVTAAFGGEAFAAGEAKRWMTEFQILYPRPNDVGTMSFQSSKTPVRARPLQFSADGKHLLRPIGGFFRPESDGRESALPTYHEDFMIALTAEDDFSGLSNQPVTLRTVKNEKFVKELPALPELARPLQSRLGVGPSFSDRIHYFPHLSLLVTLATSDDHVIFRKFSP